MDQAEQRAVLEGIARDEDAYPRDRIAAVRALRDMDLHAEEEERRAEETHRQRTPEEELALLTK